MNFYFLIFFVLSSIKISSENEEEKNIIIYSKELFQITCDSHFFYLSMKISSSKTISTPISFELNLISPSNLRMKCMLYNIQLECFSFVPDGYIYRQEDLFFNIFYNPPKIKGYEFDLISFRKNSRKWENTTMCGNENYLLNGTKVDYNSWAKFRLNFLSGGECEYFYEDKEQKNVFYFNMSLDIEDENIIKYLKESNERNIEFIQEIKAPISVNYEDYMNLNPIETKDYAFCKNNDTININNYKNIEFRCKINIAKSSILNGYIKIFSFFDKILYKISNTQNEFESLNIFINVTNSELDTSLNNTFPNFLLLNNLLCPNLPIFTIKNKNTGIFFDSYQEKTNSFIFYLNGTLTNGYKYVNNTLYKFTQTTKEISFDLFLKENKKQEGIPAKCILSSSSFYHEENTLIKCVGNKPSSLEENNENIPIDMHMNYVNVKKNNEFKDIIINWPKWQYFENKKNFFSVKIYALSIQRKYSICEEGNFFTFYLNIYDMLKEIKIIFDLPLVEPKGYVATCELLDQRTLVCTIDLRYKKIFKSEKIILPEKDKQINITNEEGNKINFIVFDDNNYIVMEEDCGENIVFGAMKEIGISKKRGIIIGICVIIFLLILIAFGIFYIIHCILRCKAKGKKLPMTEESKIQKDQ